MDVDHSCDDVSEKEVLRAGSARESLVVPENQLELTVSSSTKTKMVSFTVICRCELFSPLFMCL